MSTEYAAATWGAQVRWITLGLGGVLLFGPAALFLTFKGIGLMEVGLLTGVSVIILGITALYRVCGYRIEGLTLYVCRTFWETSIPLDGLHSVEIDPKALKGAFKLIGNDGLFAIHGSFRSRHLGRFRAFATDPKNSVVLRTADGVIVVTPENPRSFQQAANRLIRRNGGRR
jgi:hypothetical protein